MPEESIKHTTNPFAVYSQNPLGIWFQEQEKGEKIILLLRQHLVTQIPAVLQIIILLLIPLFIVPLVNLLRVDFFSALAASQLFWIGLFWYVFVFGFSFYKFIFWYFNVYMLTNERIVDFDFKGILHMETSYANLMQIEDVSPKIIGFFGTFFHYGDVFIQTAGEKPEFEFHRVARPDSVARRILTEVRSEESESPGVIA